VEVQVLSSAPKELFMPEQVYIDLTPGLEDIPAETWAGIDADELAESLINQIPVEHRVGLHGLRSVLSKIELYAKPVRVSEEVRSRSWLSPELLRIVDQAADQQEARQAWLLNKS
jgi:hypothetical protein